MKQNRLLLSMLIAGFPLISLAQNASPCLVGSLGQTLVSQGFAPQSAQFTITVDVTPSSSTLQNSVGLSQGVQTAESQLVALTRFNADGLIDARNGEQFSATRRVRYYPELTYRVRFDVNVAVRSYSVWVQLRGAGETQPFLRIARDFAFNPARLGVPQLDTLGVLQAPGRAVPDFTAGDTLQACNLAVQGQGSAAPQANLTASMTAARLAPPAVPLPPNADCSLIVPEDPLTADGLAKPYQLVATDPAEGACSETTAEQRAFVQAAIISLRTGQISIYSPLVIDKGTAPAVAPVLPSLPRDAVVAIWFGYNGSKLTLQGSGRRRGGSLRDGNCVNGVDGSVFGQFAYCNASEFIDAVKTAFARGRLQVPPLGTGIDGQACPSTRSYWEVDQDPSDNVPTEYLLINGRVAQNTALNRQNNPGAVKIVNPSDERLVAVALDGALRCTPFTAPDLADPGHNVPALALNEIQATVFQERPMALIPPQDPMVLVDGERNLEKLNLYREGVGQPQANNVSDRSAANFCENFRDDAPPRIFLDKPFFVTAPSVVPADASNLFTFMASRYVTSYALLDCRALLGRRVNVRLTKDANGVVVDATLTR